MKPPAPFNPADADKIVLYTGPDFSGPVVRRPPVDEDGTNLVEFFSGQTDDVSTGRLTEASVVDQVMFMSDRNDFIQIYRNQRAEIRQLDDENQDLARGDEVFAIPNRTLVEIKEVIDLWVDRHIRPDRWLPFLLDRRKLWAEMGVLCFVEKPARDMGKHFLVRRTSHEQPQWTDWYAVRRKPLARKRGKTDRAGC